MSPGSPTELSLGSGRQLTIPKMPEETEGPSESKVYTDAGCASESHPNRHSHPPRLHHRAPKENLKPQSKCCWGTGSAPRPTSLLSTTGSGPSSHWASGALPKIRAWSTVVARTHTGWWKACLVSLPAPHRDIDYSPSL